MSTMESRILGPIELSGGAGGGAMDAVMPFVGREIPVRLEIDYPDRLNQSLVDDLDVVLEHTDIPDRLARDAIARQLDRDDSAPAQLFRAWEGIRGRGQSADAFLHDLQATRVTITPDGGTINLDRLVLRYGLTEPSISDEITVRLPSSPTGPEVDRDLRPRR